MTAIHFLNQVSDFSGSYAFGVELDNRAFQNIRVLLVVRQREDVLENMIIKLYSKGITTREIADLIEKMYGSHYSGI